MFFVHVSSRRQIACQQSLRKKQKTEREAARPNAATTRRKCLFPSRLSCKASVSDNRPPPSPVPWSGPARRQRGASCHRRAVRPRPSRKCGFLKQWARYQRAVWSADRTSTTSTGPSHGYRGQSSKTRSTPGERTGSNQGGDGKETLLPPSLHFLLVKPPPLRLTLGGRFFFLFLLNYTFAEVDAMR